ncbi:MAG: 4-hydroxy-tetrahydrodipicolinate synthase [Crocinitomicaceae bacterium]|nr:4-hydroxy-tetrahydrodipicolinate synthase [Crocinitomicaceae bacterium]
MNKFKGTGVALVTPFRKEGEVDFNALQKLVEFQIENGVNYLVVQGTTGESVTLTDEEKVSVLEYIIDVTKNRVPIVLGVGGNNTSNVVQQIKKFNSYRIDAYLSVSPYYNKPSQSGIVAHYGQIAQATDKPIILYNVPGRTGSNMTAETTLTLANTYANIIAVKEASGNLEQIMEIIKNKPSDFLVISGDDALTLPHIACGGDGVISVVANAFPKRFSSMVDYALKGDLEKAKPLHYELFPIIQQLFADGNPGGIKYVLKLISIGEDHMRLPLVNINDEVAKKLYELVAAIDDTLA